MSLYSLTHLTGRKRNADRKIIIATIETSKSGFLVSVVAVVLSIIPTAPAVMIFGPSAMLIVPPICVAAALYLFRSQSQKGLRLPMYRTLLDKGAAKRIQGQILVCNVPIQKHAVMSRVAYSSEAAEHVLSTDIANQHVAGAKSIRRTTAPAYGVATDNSTPRTTEASPLWN
jgi:hypothetical protein